MTRFALREEDAVTDVSASNHIRALCEGTFTYVNHWFTSHNMLDIGEVLSWSDAVINGFYGNIAYHLKSSKCVSTFILCTAIPQVAVRETFPAQPLQYCVMQG